MTLAFSNLVTAYLTRHPAAAARALMRKDAREAGALLEAVGVDAVLSLLSHMSHNDAGRALGGLSDERARALMTTADFVRVASWLTHLDKGERERLTSLLPPAVARNVAEALEFPPGTAGELMDPRVVTFHDGTTVDDAIARVRRLESARGDDLLLTDDEGHLSGVVRIRDLLRADGKASLAAIADRGRPSVHVMASRDEVVELLGENPAASLPVVDLDGRVLGVLRHEGLVEAARQAATDDLQQMVGAGKEERALSPALFAVKSRLPWLLINLATGFLAATVVGLFDETIAKITALAVLMPVVAGQAGNTGAQALAVTIRGLSLREIRLGHFPKVLVKETVTAAVNGVAIAVVTSIGTYFWSYNIELSAVIGISMVFSMVIAAIAGAAVPVVLTALKRDPATASSIILTTVTDVTGFSSFLGLASLLASRIVS